jgi:RNA polymerase sigma-70 factor (ECF subfamily)
MTEHADQLDRLTERLRQGDAAAAGELFTLCRPRLRSMVKLRLDRRLRGRVDPSDVLQEAFLDVQKKAAEFAAKTDLPPYLWLRLITAEQVVLHHRRHLGARMRDAGQEVSLYRGGLPFATTHSLANLLLGREPSPSQAAIRAERQLRLQEALNQLDPLDREVLALRHFEDLSNAETATALGLTKTAASNRYVRALKRLKDALSALPEI